MDAFWIFKKAGENNPRNDHDQFWQQENHPIECSTSDILDPWMKYLHENSLRGGIVRKESDFAHSSTIDYYEEKEELIAIDYIWECGDSF